MKRASPPCDRGVPTAPGAPLCRHAIDTQPPQVRLSVNLMNRTIEEVVAKMQTSALGLIDLISEDLRFNGAPALCLEPLDTLELICVGREPEWYNNSDNYKRAVEAALNTKKDVRLDHVTAI